MGRKQQTRQVEKIIRKDKGMRHSHRQPGNQQQQQNNTTTQQPQQHNKRHQNMTPLQLLHSPIGEYRVEKFPALPVAAPMFFTVTCCCCDCDWTLARDVKLSRVLREAEMVVVSISVTLRMVVEVTTVVLLLLLLFPWLVS